MKKVFIIASMACTILFSACSSNSNNESDNSNKNGLETMGIDSTSMNDTDSTKAALDKMAKDSADAAHGHSH